MLILATFVNIYQKVTQQPLVMDLLFALSMAAPIPITAQAVTDHVPVVVWSAAASLFFLALQLNSIGGNLKDLKSDRETGFKTIAVTRGATIAPDGSLVPGRRYRRYCWNVQVITTLSLLVTAGLAVQGRRWPEVVAIAAVAVAACVLGARDLRRLLSGTRRPSRRGTQTYFGGGFATFLAAFAAHSYLPVFLTAIGLLTIWTAGFSLYWWWYSRPPAGCRREPGGLMDDVGLRQATKAHYEEYPFIEGGSRRTELWRTRLRHDLLTMSSRDKGSSTPDAAPGKWQPA